MPVLIARVESTSLQPDSTRGDDQGPVVNPRNFFLQAMEGGFSPWAALFFLRTTALTATAACSFTLRRSSRATRFRKKVTAWISRSRKWR